MKKKIIISCIFLFVLSVAKTQNVGIGTETPIARFEVKDTLNSKLYISSKNYNDSSQLVFRNRNSIDQGTDFLITSRREKGLYLTSASDIANNNNDSLLVIQTNGNMGLGVKVPQSRLDINGNVRVSGFNSIELGAGVSGKEVNAGKIGYRTFTTDALDIVGAGAGTTDRKIHVYAEGGTTFTGPVNALSSIQINGNSGQSGQVLTSTGTSAPQWKALSNDNIRFGVTFYGVTTPLPVSNIYYNLSPSDVIITGGSNSITFNQSGLYHFEGTYSGLVQGSGFSGAPEYSTFMSFSGSTTYALNLCVWKQLTLRTSVINNWYHQDKFSIDLQVTAPAQLQFGRLFLTGAVTPSYVDANVTVFGYRISQ